jgi:hypothetical protein
MQMVLNKLSNLALRNSSKRNILLLFITFLIFYLLIFPSLVKLIVTNNQLPLLDTQFGFNAGTGYTTLDSFGESGRKTYLFTVTIIDGIFPLIYGTLLSLLFGFLYVRTLPKRQNLQLINLLPLLAITFDYAENINIALMLLHYPERIDLVAQMASIAGVMKWILLTLCLAFVMAGTIGWLLRKFFR